MKPQNLVFRFFVFLLRILTQYGLCESQLQHSGTAAQRHSGTVAVAAAAALTVQQHGSSGSGFSCSVGVSSEKAETENGRFRIIALAPM